MKIKLMKSEATLKRQDSRLILLMAGLENLAETPSIKGSKDLSTSRELAT